MGTETLMGFKIAALMLHGGKARRRCAVKAAIGDERETARLPRVFERWLAEYHSTRRRIRWAQAVSNRSGDLLPRIAWALRVINRAAKHWRDLGDAAWAFGSHEDLEDCRARQHGYYALKSAAIEALTLRGLVVTVIGPDGHQGAQIDDSLFHVRREGGTREARKWDSPRALRRAVRLLRALSI
jgi:hypothetical protein